MQLQNPTNSVAQLAKSVVENFVRLPNMTDVPSAECDNGVQVCVCNRVALSLVAGFHDKADGDRLLHYWKFIYIVLNYAKEAINLLLHFF